MGADLETELLRTLLRLLFWQWCTTEYRKCRGKGMAGEKMKMPLLVLCNVCKEGMIISD